MYCPVPRVRSGRSSTSTTASLDQIPDHMSRWNDQNRAWKNFICHGTSAVVASEPGDAYTAETALRTVAQVFQEQGCPDRIVLDRDPRWANNENWESFWMAG
jgi:hypothetical protein